MELEEQLQAALGDAYRLERELQGGGMSRLWIAIETALARKVVVKLLPPELASEISAARFQREIRVAAILQHPNILPVLTSGAKDDLLYYIMPWVAGESLRQRLERDQRLPYEEALQILREVADALAYAHSEGVVHRDIKPANILLVQGHAVLTDFGIARALNAAQDAGQRLTATGMGIGTVGYMAPEQVMGETDVDARADMYALAVVGYEMLAGSRPFTGPTGQAVFTAQLMDEVQDLAKLRDDVPAPVAAAIAKALASDPAHRFSTTMEFKTTLELPRRSSGTVARPSFRRGLVAGGALATAVIVGLALAKTRMPPALDRNVVAVAPFEVRDADTTWREGLVDVLSRKLDGAGDLRSVPATIAINRFTGRVDRESARALGRATGAAYVVFGALLRETADTVALSAAILDVAGDRVLGGAEVERRGHRDEINRLADSVTVALLREVAKVRPVGAFRQTSLGASSLPALKAFLQGEQYYRRSAWDSAMAYFERAIAADSGFALALRHAGLVASWQRGGGDSLARALLLRAGRHNRGLPLRDSLLVAADSLFAALTTFEEDTAYNERARRLFQALDQAKRSYPDDPEVWFAAGEAMFHYGYGPGLSIQTRQILDAFSRSLALDSSFAPSYIHPVELALSANDEPAARRYLAGYLALDPSDVEAEGLRLLESLLAAEGDETELKALLDTASADALFNAWIAVRRWPDPGELAIRIAATPARRAGGSDAWFTTEAARRVLHARQLAFRGHLAAAYALVRDVPPGTTRLIAELVLLGAVPPEQVASHVARWLESPTGFPTVALPVLAGRGDTARIAELGRRADRLAASARSPTERRDATYRSAIVPAYAALARRDTAEALRHFAAVPDSLCMACYLDRLTHARLLVQARRDADAARLLDERLAFLLTPIEVVYARERSAVARRLDQRQKADEADRWARAVWAQADSTVR